MIIWLASYPRSGNTFLRILLNQVFSLQNYSLYNDHSDIAADSQTAELVGHALLPENFSIDRARRDEKLYVIKTHDLPVNAEDKVIYLLRDGRESSLSYLNYLQSYGFPETTLLDVIYGNVFFGSWGDHVEAWTRTNPENFLLIKFEELIREPGNFIETIAGFIHRQPKQEKLPEFSTLQSINPKFFRSGKTDSWKKVFNDEEHLSFWMKNYQQMMQYGYNKDMPEMLLNVEPTTIISQFARENTKLSKHLHMRNAQVMEAKQQEITALNQLVEKRDRQIYQQADLISQRDKHIDEQRLLVEEQKAIIDSREIQIHKLKEINKARDIQIAKQRDKIAQCDHQIHAKNGLIKQLNQAMETYRDLARAVEQMRNKGSAVKHPFSKFSAYKDMLAAHDKVNKS